MTCGWVYLQTLGGGEIGGEGGEGWYFHSIHLAL